MAHWDDQIGLSRSALAAVPLLLLPMVAGAAILLLLPGSGAGTAAIVFSSIAVAWYLLGGAVALAHMRRRIGERRALAAIRGEVTAAPEAVWICDSDGLVLYQNPPSRARFGDIAGQNVVGLLARMRADAGMAHELLTRRADRNGCAEIALEDGMVLGVCRAEDAPLQIWSCHDPDSLPAEGDIALALDSAEAGETCDGFEPIPVALLRLAPNGEIRRANAAARRLLGLSGIGNGGLHLGGLLEGPGRSVGDWVADCFNGRMENGTEILRLRSRDGRDQYFQVSLARDAGAHPAVVAVLTDASDLKRLEAQFAQSQKMQAIGQLAGGVAHDFNNLLTAISGHCDLLMLRRDKGDPDYADLDQISQNANRAAALVGQLLAFSRKQTLKLEPLDLRDTLADLAHLLNRLVGERVGLSISHDPALRQIRADRRQLEQVIMNLVVNARDAMSAGGEISIRTENLHFAQPFQRDRATLPAGDYVRIELRDQGCGIAPENLGKIFEPFFTTKRVGEGTGLGLSTAYGIVKQTGGYIFCDSTPGEGTCFSLYFPAHLGAAVPQPAVSARPVAAASRASQRPVTVLLVEDEAPVRAFAARALRLKGYQVREADCAEAALELLADDRLQVDVFVTDVVMPGMDGPSWVRSALKHRPRTRVIFMSGYSEDIFTEGQAPIPNSAFLAKPFTLAELAELVERQMATPPAISGPH
ncbi:ATP-binding protein [Paracoccus siganidrum]|nr:ATP-binding protein [Paracoccus siganidrum]